jgi:DNA-binding transcriptional LysR family regulator
MRNKVDVSDIEAFAAVGNVLSFKAAAGALNISPSALSRRIQKLEAQLDIRLLDRTTRDVRLTLPGKQFLARAQEIIAGIDELVTAIKGGGTPRAAALSIATIPSIVHQILPEAIRTFNARHPTTRVKIRDQTTNEIFDLVQRGEADFGITSFLPHDASLEFVPLLRRAFVLVVPRDHVLAGRRAVRWAELAPHRVISTWKGAGVRVAMDLNLAKAHNPLASFYEVQQIYTALRFVEAGLGVAPVPGFFLGSREATSLSVVPLIEPVIEVDLGTILSRNHPLRGQALEFWNLVHGRDGAGDKPTRARRSRG